MNNNANNPQGDPITPAHHPQGPSTLKYYDPLSGGCLMWQKAEGASIDAELGTLDHLAYSTGDLSLLEGDQEHEAWVGDALRFFAKRLYKYPERYHEVRLEIPGLNFGTIDILAFSKDGREACVGDLKFGLWRVDRARRNLQLRNYAAFVFHNYLKVERIQIIIFHARYHEHSSCHFTRASFARLTAQVAGIISAVRRAQASPREKDYTPNPRVCGFCSRLNCVKRLQLVSQTLSVWSGVTVPVVSTDLSTVSNDVLLSLKVINNALKTFSKAIDDEARHRIINLGQTLPGYEVREITSPRKIIGIENLQSAAEVLVERLRGVNPEMIDGLEKALLAQVELSVSNLEQAVREIAPTGTKTFYQNLVAEILTAAKLIDAHPVFTVRAIRE